MKRIIITSVVLALVLSMTAFGLRRPVGFRGIGPRVGLTVNPDQFHVGFHLDLGDLSNNFMMQPNLEIGFGQNVTTIAPTFELDYRFRNDWGVWTPYLGGGVGPVIYSSKHGHSNSELGVYLQFGIGKGRSASQSGRFFVEGKLGLADAPDFKATVGWTFGK